MRAKEFALHAHGSTAHYYDKYLPYEFHLRMVVKVAEDFSLLIPAGWHEVVTAACWLHDTIEDCRCSYRDVLNASRYEVAEIVRAVTNDQRGRNRKERMPMQCYTDIRETTCAVFVKLCDRIANVQYSKMTGSKMFEMYKNEQEYFQAMLNVEPSLQPMWDYLNNLFLCQPQ